MEYLLLMRVSMLVYLSVSETPVSTGKSVRFGCPLAHRDFRSVPLPRRSAQRSRAKSQRREEQHEETTGGGT
jgi:hypothetical protein